MIVQDFASAQILFILASDNLSEVRGLERDLKRSKYRYLLVSHSHKATLVEAVSRQIQDAKIPAVLVINFNFAAKFCMPLLQIARDATRTIAIECVVTHPPAQSSQRETLLALGARLFDGDAGMALTELTLH
jgi:hypothetical protein